MPLNIPRPPKDLPPELQNWASAISGELERFGRESATSWLTTDPTNASNITSGILAASFGGTGINNSTNTLTLSGGAYTLAGITTSRTITFPDASDTVATLGQAQTITGNKSFNSGTVILKGATSGTLTVIPAAVAGANTLTLPAGTTDFSATGGTSQVVKQTSAAGALTVARLALSDLSDTTTATSWTPSDQSGAALTFTSVAANYYKIGNIIFAYGTLTYPITADGSVAKISLPVAVPNSSYANVPGTVMSSGGVAGTILQANQNTSTATFRVIPSGGITNAQMSGGTVSFFIAYPAA